ncbi:MAG: hypothetical protein HQ538_00890 [Parcubacteria group bacterium]|nr:hypothetical protein [Parcubacteria group bacterium]
MSFKKQEDKKNKLPIYSIIALIIANVYQLIGVLFYGWNMQEILLVYWLEVVIVALFFILKILTMVNQTPKVRKTLYNIGPAIAPLGRPTNRMLLVLVFITHFIAFFGLTTTILSEFFSAPINYNTLSTIFSLHNKSNIQYAVLVLVISHLFSFIVNYLRKERNNKISFKQSLTLPYKRLGALGLAICMSGIISLILGSDSKMEFGASVMMGIIVAKIIADVIIHIRERLDYGKNKEKAKVDQPSMNDFNPLFFLKMSKKS